MAKCYSNTTSVSEAVEEGLLRPLTVAGMSQSIYECVLCVQTMTGTTPAEFHLRGKVHRKKLQNSSCRAAVHGQLLKSEVADTNVDPVKVVYGSDTKSPDINEKSSPFISTTSVNGPVGNAVKRKAEAENFSGDKDNFICKLCNIPCTGLRQLESHNLGERHRKRLRMMQNGESNQGNASSEVLPSSSSSSVCTSTPIRLDHLKANKEDPVQKAIEEGYIYWTTEENVSKIICKVCNIDCSGTLSMIDHLCGKTHLKKLRRHTRSGKAPFLGSSPTCDESFKPDSSFSCKSSVSNFQKEGDSFKTESAFPGESVTPSIPVDGESVNSKSPLNCESFEFPTPVKAVTPKNQANGTVKSKTPFDCESLRHAISGESLTPKIAVNDKSVECKDLFNSQSQFPVSDEAVMPKVPDSSESVGLKSPANSESQRFTVSSEFLTPKIPDIGKSGKRKCSFNNESLTPKILVTDESVKPKSPTNCETLGITISSESLTPKIPDNGESVNPKSPPNCESRISKLAATHESDSATSSSTECFHESPEETRTSLGLSRFSQNPNSSSSSSSLQNEHNSCVSPSHEMSSQNASLSRDTDILSEAIEGALVIYAEDGLVCLICNMHLTDSSNMKKHLLSDQHIQEMRNHIEYFQRISSVEPNRSRFSAKELDGNEASIHDLSASHIPADNHASVHVSDVSGECANNQADVNKSGKSDEFVGNQAIVHESSVSEDLAYNQVTAYESDISGVLADYKASVLVSNRHADNQACAHDSRVSDERQSYDVYFPSDPLHNLFTF